MKNQNAKKFNIAVVGGGVSGLVSAYFLSNLGFRVSVYEKEKSLGGLVGGIDLGKGGSIEKFYHHNLGGDKHFLKLIEELGLNDFFRLEKSSTGVFSDQKFYDFNTSLDLLRLKFLPCSSRIILGIGGVLIAFLPGRFLKKKTAGEICRRFLGGKNWNLFWRPLFWGKFGNYTDKISAEWFGARLKSRIESRKAGGEFLRYPRGGYKIFFDKLSSQIIKNGGEIILGQKADQIKKEGKKYAILGKYFDAVLTAVPLKNVFEIAPFTKAGDLKVKYLGVINLVLFSKKPLTKYYWTNVLDVRAPFTGIIEHTNLISEKEYGGRHVIYLTKYLNCKEPEYKKSDQQIYESWTNFLHKIVDFSDEDIIKFYVFRSPSAQPISDVSYKKLPSKLTGCFYATSMAHIYPEDRGMEQAVRQAEKISGEIVCDLLK